MKMNSIRLKVFNTCTIVLLVVCTGGCAKRGQMSGDDIYRDVHVIQLKSQPKKYKSGGIAINGYLHYSSDGSNAESSFLLYPSREDFYAENVNFAVFLKAKKNLSLFPKCDGSYVTVLGNFVYKNGLMYMNVDRASVYIRVPPVGDGYPIEDLKKDSLTNEPAFPLYPCSKQN